MVQVAAFCISLEGYEYDPKRLPMKAYQKVAGYPRLLDDELTPDEFVVSRPSYFAAAAGHTPNPNKEDLQSEDSWVASSNLLMLANGISGSSVEDVEKDFYPRKLVADVKKTFDQDPKKSLLELL